MNRFPKFKLLLAALALAPVFHADSILACAACYGGRTDSRLAVGMNWGIFSLLGVVVCVLGGIAGFFIFLAKRSAAAATPEPRGELLESTQKA